MSIDLNGNVKIRNALTLTGNLNLSTSGLNQLISQLSGGSGALATQS